MKKYPFSFPQCKEMKQNSLELRSALLEMEKQLDSKIICTRNLSRLRLIWAHITSKPSSDNMCEMFAKFHQNWWCGFWEKRSHKTNICGFIYRIRLFLRRHISNSSINTNIASWSSYVYTYLWLIWRCNTGSSIKRLLISTYFSLLPGCARIRKSRHIPTRSTAPRRV